MYITPWVARVRVRLMVRVGVWAVSVGLLGCGGSGGSMELADDLSAAAPVPGPTGGASKSDAPVPGELVAFPPVPLATPSDATGGNVLLNGGFEQISETAPADAPALLQWTLEPSGSTSAAPSRDQSAEGVQSLRIDASGDGGLVARQQVTGQGQYPHLLRALVLPQGLTGEARLAVHARRGDREVLTAQSRSVTGTSDRWEQLELRFEPPAFLEGFDVLLTYQPGADGEDGVCWLDRCELYRLPAPEGANLVRNGAFAEGPDNELWYWNWWQQHDIALVSSDLGAQFPRCLQVAAPGNKSFGIGQALKEAKPGERYLVRGYLKCENLEGTARMVLQSEKTGLRTAIEGVSGTQDWTWLQQEFEAPAGGDDLLIVLNRDAAPDWPETVGKAWFANVEVIPAAAADN